MAEKNFLTEKLFEAGEREYAAFQAGLTPNVDPALFIGVRVPTARKLAKAYGKSPEAAEFIQQLPHTYFDENMLHGMLLSQIKNYEDCLARVEAFLPYVDNWAVCDTMSPKVFEKNKEQLYPKLMEWIASEHVYTCRFGMEMLMRYYLDADFTPAVLELPAAVLSEEYYVNMMVAWFFATALAKQWDAAIPYLENRRLGVWVHNKTIQKAIESYRITPEQKVYLRSLKVKK